MARRIAYQCGICEVRVSLVEAYDDGTVREKTIIVDSYAAYQKLADEIGEAKDGYLKNEKSNDDTPA